MRDSELHHALSSLGWERVDRSNGRVDYYKVNSMIATIPDCEEALCQVREGHRRQMNFDAALAWATGTGG